MKIRRLVWFLAVTAVLAAGEPATAQTPPSREGGTASMTAVRRAMGRGDFAEARKLLRRGAAAAKRADAPAWLILEAELELAAKRFDRAGLAGMKVVVLHARSDQVANGLYWTARCYENLGRPEKSLQLYEECIQHKRALPSLREEARKRAAAVRKSMSSE